MAKKKKRPAPLTAQERVAVLSQRYTQKEIARKLKVTTRTIQRWKAGVNRPSKENAPGLASAARRERAALRQQSHRAGVTQTGNVPLPAQRQTRRDPKKPHSKKRVPSDTVIFDARHVDMEAIARSLELFKGKDRNFRVIYYIPAGWPDSDKTIRSVGVYRSTAWQSLLTLSTEGIRAFLRFTARRGHLHYFVLTLKKRKRKK